MSQNPYILHPRDLAEARDDELGGKAANLLRLERAGFRVPRWFAVSTQAYLHSLSGRTVPTEVPAEVEKAVLAAFETAFAGGRVAVRSSAIGEDGSALSFAGQMKTFLHVVGADDLLAALLGCWASADAPGIAAYRQLNGLPPESVRVAVVVQEMVEAEASGVAFTANPITGDRDEIVIRAAYGLGEGVVADLVETDGYAMRQDDVVAEIAPKTRQVVRDPSTGKGTVVAEVPVDLRDKPVLDDPMARELARTARAIEAAFGAPQDIEWAVAGGQLYILQARPITTLRETLGSRETVWDNSNITESYSGVTSALTFSFASNAYQIVYQQVCELLGVSAPTIQANSAAFRNMLGLMKGRVFYNLKNWYRLVSLLPGFEANKTFMEQMMGIKDTAPISKHETRAGFVERVGPLAYVAWRVIRNYLALERHVAEFTDRFYAIYEVQRKRDLAAMSPHEIVEMYDLLEREILRHWKAPILTDLSAMVFRGVLERLCARWCSGAGDSLQNGLLCGEGGIESTEPTKALMRMAQRIKADPALRAEFEALEPSGIRRWLFEGAASGTKATLQADMRAFLDRFGFRCMNELKLEELSLKDDPTFAFVTIQNYLRLADPSVEAMEAKEREIRTQAEKRASQALGLNPFKRAFFGWILANARRHVKNRENMRFARTRIFGLCREMFNALGAKFASVGLLDSPRDIYHLTVPEILAFVEGRAVCTDLKALTTLRREEFDRYRQEDIPDRFSTRGISYLDAMEDGSTAPQSDDPDVLVGTSCCPGRVKGPVRVILSPRDDMRLDGQILVAERTDPGWVPLYPSAAGLLIERGSILSHSAIVARELGIPAIVGIRDLVKRVHDGQHVDMDARAGKVYLTPQSAIGADAPPEADLVAG